MAMAMENGGFAAAAFSARASQKGGEGALKGALLTMGYGSHPVYHTSIR